MKAVDYQVLTLCGFIHNRQAFNQYASDLTEDRFTELPYQQMYTAMLELGDSFTSADIAEKVESQGGLALVRDVSKAYRRYGVDKNLTNEQVRRLASQVEKTGRIRQIRQLMQSAVDLLDEDKIKKSKAYKDDETYIASLIADIATYQYARADSKGYTPYNVAIEQYRAKYAAIQRGEKLVDRVPTGLKTFDKAVGGLLPEGLIVVGGLPGSGKTQLAWQWALNNAIRYRHDKEKKFVAVHSLEMTGEALAERGINSFAEIDSVALREGKYITDEDADKRIRSEFEHQKNLPIFIDDSGFLTSDIISGRITGLRARTGDVVGLVITDFAELVSDKGDSQEQRVSSVFIKAKALAKRLHCPVILLSQLSRAVELSGTKVPTIRHLRYCLPAGSLIPDPETGLWKPIELISSGAVWALKDNRLQPSYAKVRKNKKQRIIRIESKSGFVLRCSPEHPVMKSNGQWTPASQLIDGDVVMIAKKIVPTSVKKMCPDKALILGLLLGDGYMPPKRGGPYYVEPDNSVLLAFYKALKHAFPDVTTTKKWHRGAWSVSAKKKDRHACGAERMHSLNRWLEALGVRGVYSKDRRLPDEVFSWDDNALAALLRGLFTADGSTGPSGGTWAVGFSSVSERLVLDVKRALLRFGIRGWVQVWKGSTLVTISSGEDVELFRKHIGFVGKKQKRLLKAKLPKQSSRSDLLPAEACNKAIDVYKVTRNIGYNHTITRARAIRIDKDNHLDFWTNPDIAWESIKVSREPAELTYSVSVPGCHNFLAGAFVTHNSGMAEAAADMVVLIYNPSGYLSAGDYKPHPQMPAKENVAYLILGKNKEGPTGFLTMHFIPKYTRWGDLVKPSVAKLEQVDSQG